MKIIEISDELYKRLKEISEAIKTQNNRSTAKPYFYQIQTKELVAVPEGCGTECYHNDGSQIETEEEINQTIFEYKDGKMLIKEIQKLDDWEKEGILEDAGWQKGNYDYKDQYENAFFTEKGCREHIRLNKHHYNEPVDYLTHAFRNPDMETIFEFFKAIAGI
jgi:hypothetical protein